MRSRSSYPRRGSVCAFAGASILLLLAGCGGPDLGKQNFDRSTESIEPGQGRGKVPDGPIESEAVSVDKLRGIDPCGVLKDGTLDRLGEPGDFSTRSWSECTVDVTDPAGKDMEIRLEVGADMGTLATDPSGELSGLPLTVDKRDTGGCDVTVTSSEDSELGITAEVQYEDGQACRAGKVVLDEVVQRLHDDPATLPDESDSLLRADPCTTLDGADVSDVLDEEVTGQPTDIHGCKWKADDPAVTVTFEAGYGPVTSDDGDKVDLGSDIEGYSEQTSDDIDVCHVGWSHRELDDRRVELVMVSYDDYSGDPKSDKPCDKAESAAKSVVSSLPDAT